MATCLFCADKELTLEISDVYDIEYGVKGRFSFRKCPQCGLLKLFPEPSVESLKSYYPPDYHGFNISERGLISLLYRLVYFFKFREYEHLIGSKGRILDVGCADAPYFETLKKKYPDFQLTGVEFKDEIAEKGRAKGRNIITGTIHDLEANGSHDLIIMNNLIEHVLDPVKELKTAYALLNPGGYVLLETPNTDCWDYLIARKNWGSLHVPRHTYLFSPVSIRLLAKRVGFEVKGISYLLSTDNWALSIQNFLQRTRVFKFELKSGRAWYYKYLLLFFIPFCAVQAFFRKTGSFVVRLQKPQAQAFMDNVEQQRIHYDRVAQAYFTNRQSCNHLVFKDLLWTLFFRNKEYLKGKPLNVLEPMCGYAEGKSILEKHLNCRIDYEGFDYSDACLKIACTIYPGINVFKMDATKFKTDKKFDLVILIGGLHHIPHYAGELLKTVHAILKDGGYFINFEPTQDNALFKMIRKNIYQHNAMFDAETEAAVDLPELNEMYSESGFTIIDQMYPGLLAYILYFNPEAFSFSCIGNRTSVQVLFDLEKWLYRNVLGRKLSFATLSLLKK